MLENLSPKEQYDRSQDQKRAAQAAANPVSSPGRSRRIWLTVGIILIVTVLGIYWLNSSGNSNGNGDLPNPELKVNELSADENILGSATALIKLIEYSDFQCPACALYAPVLAQLSNEFGDQLVIAYRHFPLRSIHPNANAAAQAAQAAAASGKFWLMSEKLFTGQKEWSDSRDAFKIFNRYAGELNLDLNKFAADYASAAVKDRIDRDYDSALKAGLNSTPTFFLNGVKIENPRSYAEFKNLINAKLTPQ